MQQQIHTIMVKNKFSSNSLYNPSIQNVRSALSKSLVLTQLFRSYVSFNDLPVTSFYNSKS